MIYNTKVKLYNKNPNSTKLQFFFVFSHPNENLKNISSHVLQWKRRYMSILEGTLINRQGLQRIIKRL